MKMTCWIIIIISIIINLYLQTIHSNPLSLSLSLSLLSTTPIALFSLSLSLSLDLSLNSFFLSSTMLDLRGRGGLFGTSYTDDDLHDYSRSYSENPLLLLDSGNHSSSSRLIIDHDYSDSPSLMTMMNNNNNRKISFSSTFSLPTTTASKYSTSHGESAEDNNQRIIEFNTAPPPLPRRIDDDGDYESDGATSPPLWKNTNSKSTKSTTTPTRPYNYNRFLSLPTTTTTTTTTTTSHRYQEIARGRQELMEMIRNMPENSYELSLKDLIEHPTTVDNHQEAAKEKELNTTNNNKSSMIPSPREPIKADNKQVRILKRSKSIDSNGNGPFLLKLFPFSFGLNKKNNKNKSLKKGTCYYAKVSPRPVPPLMEGDQKSTSTVDKEWWKKKFSVAGGDHTTTTTTTETNGVLETIGEGSGSSNSSGRSRRMGGFLTGCWSFYNKKTKTLALKGRDF